MPTFFADECVARAIVDGLIQRGLDVVDAKDICRGDTHERVLSLAEAAGRLVIIHDWGFGEMTIRLGQIAAGVIILSSPAPARLGRAASVSYPFPAAAVFFATASRRAM